jgi:hypothetical protein
VGLEIFSGARLPITISLEGLKPINHIPSYLICRFLFRVERGTYVLEVAIGPIQNHPRMVPKPAFGRDHVNYSRVLWVFEDGRRWSVFDRGYRRLA